MNHFKSLRIGNNPLLLIGCTVIAYGVTHFYFKNSDSSKIANIIGHILLSPVYLFETLSEKLGTNDFSDNAIVIFFVLLVSYSIVALSMNKIIGWGRTTNEG